MMIQDQRAADLRPFEPYIRQIKANDQHKMLLGYDDDDLRNECRLRAWKALEALRARAPGDLTPLDELKWVRRALRNFLIDIARKAGARSRQWDDDAVVGSVAVDSSGMFAHSAAVPGEDNESLRYETANEHATDRWRPDRALAAREENKIQSAAIRILRSRISPENLKALEQRAIQERPWKPETKTAASGRYQRARAQARCALGVATFDQVALIPLESQMTIPIQDLPADDLARILFLHGKPVGALADKAALVDAVVKINTDPASGEVFDYPPCFGKEYDAADTTCTQECDFNKECSVVRGGYLGKGPLLNTVIEEKLVLIQKVARPVEPAETLDPEPVAPPAAKADKPAPKAPKAAKPAKVKPEPAAVVNPTPPTPAPEAIMLAPSKTTTKSAPAPSAPPSAAKKPHEPKLWDIFKDGSTPGRAVQIIALTKTTATLLVVAHATKAAIGKKTLTKVKNLSALEGNKRGFIFLEHGRPTLPPAPHEPVIGGRYKSNEDKKRIVEIVAVTKKTVDILTIKTGKVTTTKRENMGAENKKGFTFVEMAKPVAPAPTKATPNAFEGVKQPEKAAKPAKAAKAPKAPKVKAEKKVKPPKDAVDPVTLSDRRAVFKNGQDSYKLRGDGTRWTRKPQGSATFAAMLPVGTIVERVYEEHLYRAKKIQDGKTTERDDIKRKRDGKWRILEVFALDAEGKKKGESLKTVKGKKLVDHEGSLNQLAFYITGSNVWSGPKFFGVLPPKLDPKLIRSQYQYEAA